MSKNDRDKNNKNRRQRFGSGPVNKFQLYDQTTERDFSFKIAQARKLFNERKHADAIKILDPMTEKFSERGEFLDLLGACYASAGFDYEAREIFERALNVPPKHKYRDALNKYNLVRLCAMTGSPFIAYQYSQQIDCDVVAEALNRPSERIRCRTLITAVKQGMVMAAKKDKMAFDDFVHFSLLLDKGKLEMNIYGPDADLDEAIKTFEEVARLKLDSTTPYNNLAIIYLWQGKLEQALEKIYYILEHIDPKNIHGLSNAVRLLCSLGRREEARDYLKRLMAIKIKPSDELVKIAEALIYFNEHQLIYDRLQPLITNERLFSVLKIVDKVAYEQTLIFEIAAAANAGNLKRALELAWTSYGRFDTHQVLLDRTYEALKNEESGPLPGGRFFYWEPKLLYPQAAQAYEEIEPQLLKLPQSGKEKEAERYETSLRPFFAKFGQVALDYVAYTYWINHEPAVLKALLTQTLACGAAGTVELVKTLAFGRVGDEKQRLAALTALVEAGLVSREESITFWLNRQPQTTTFAELQKR